MTAKAEPAPIKGATITHVERDGTHYPALVYKGDKPAKGSVIRADFGGVTYEARVHAVSDEGDGMLVETSGLTPIPDPTT
ncbi:MAG TPA: hypothetical protein VF633_02570 [Brevundimonas sp.]|jgi:hypothetical protein